jgi:hypothetical protein
MKTICVTHQNNTSIDGCMVLTIHRPSTRTIVNKEVHRKTYHIEEDLTRTVGMEDEEGSLTIKIPVGFGATETVSNLSRAGYTPAVITEIRMMAPIATRGSLSPQPWMNTTPSDIADTTTQMVLIIATV